jgi:hypothetical protein
MARAPAFRCRPVRASTMVESPTPKRFRSIVLRMHGTPVSVRLKGWGLWGLPGVSAPHPGASAAP